MKYVYVKSTNGKVVTLIMDRDSLRCRQRGIKINNEKIKSLQFISYKEMKRISAINPYNVTRPREYNTISKL